MDNRALLTSKAETLAESEVDEVLEYIEIMQSERQQTSRPDALDGVMLQFLLEQVRSRSCRKSARGH